MEQEKTGTAAQTVPEEQEETRRRNKRLALALLLRLGAVAAALAVLLGAVLLVTRARGQEMFPAVKDGDLLIAYRLQRRWAQDDVVL